MSDLQHSSSRDLETFDEPAGASAESMLITTDTIEEMTQELSASLEDDASMASRLKSKALIQEIQENFVTSDGAASVQAGTSIEGAASSSAALVKINNGESSPVSSTASASTTVAPVNEMLMAKSVALSETGSESDQEAFYSGESNGSSGADDYLHNNEWLNQREHIFVISSAGKPIYSLHGNEDKLATLCGVMQALTSVVHANQDTLTSVHALDIKFVFLTKGPLILVAVSRRNLSVQQILLQLT